MSLTSCKRGMYIRVLCDINSRCCIVGKAVTRTTREIGRETSVMLRCVQYADRAVGVE